MDGLDLLGLGSPHWNIKATLDCLPSGWAIGFFDKGWPNCFGDPMPNIKKLVATGKVPAIRVQIWWDPSHHIVPLDALKKRLPVWEKFKKDNPLVKVYVSHSCEYRESNQAEIKKRIDTVLALAPSCIPVSTPMQSKSDPRSITEFHGDKAATAAWQLASTDGQSIYDIDAEKWCNNNKAAIRFLWGMRFNLAESHNTAPPSQRTAAPGASYMRGIIRLASPAGAAPQPTFVGKVRPIAKPYLWKTYAEDMIGQNRRDNLPLLIVDGKSHTCDIVTKDAVLVGRLAVFDHPGAYPGGLTRYYAGVDQGINLYAWQIAQKAKELSGSEFVWFKVDGRYYGPVNAAFRTGFYHS